jgi:outer membrane biogenesis lipoprotein LolB
MKLTIIVIITVFLFSCTNKVLLQTSFDDKCYESARGHLFAGNRICFYSDGKFKYLAHGPSVFVSEGYWKYQKSNNEIELISISLNTLNNTVDTMQIDLTSKKIKVKSGKQLLFEEILYKLK